MASEAAVHDVTLSGIGEPAEPATVTVEPDAVITVKVPVAPGKRTLTAKLSALGVTAVAFPAI